MSIDNFISNLATQIVNPIIGLLFVVALISFLWGVFQYIQSADSPEGRDKGRKHIIWSLIGMMIMMGVFSIMNIAVDTVFPG